MDTSGTLKIMAVGDSITFGWPVDGGYRSFLYDRLRKAGYNFDFVGSNTNSPPPSSWSIEKIEHEGHQGWRIRDIERWIYGWLADYLPDVMLLMIGTNNMWYKDEYLYADNELENLVNKIYTKMPKIHLFLASLTPFAANETDNNEHVCLYNCKLQEIIKKYQAAGRNIYFVDMFNALDSRKDIYDNCHPNESGYEKMADAFFIAMEGLKGRLTGNSGLGKKSVFVSDMEWIYCSSASGLPPKRDGHILDETLPAALEQHSYVKGIQTIVDNKKNPSDITVDISGDDFTVLESDVGMDDSVSDICGNAEFIVIADGKEIGRSNIMEGDGLLYHMVVKIPEKTRLLTLRVVNGGKPGTNNIANWGNATLSRRWRISN